MKYVVFGASGPTGIQAVKLALGVVHAEVAVTRKPHDFPIQAPVLKVVSADVTNPRAVADCVAGADAVISTYRVPYTRKRVTVYSEGITNIIAGMHTHSVARLVCVSSTTIAEGETPGESWLWRKAVVPVLRKVAGRTLYDDMQRMEEIVRSNDVDWTIVRRGGLFNTPGPTTDY